MTELEVINMPKSVTTTIENIGNIIFWIVVAAFGFWIISKFVANIGTLRSEEDYAAPVLVKEEAK